MNQPVPVVQSEIERTLLNLKGKHIKSVLSRLEDVGSLTKDTRKIILDGFNDLTRETLRELGFKVPD